VRLKKVRLGRNFGLTVEVLEGLKGDEKLILNPPIRWPKATRSSPPRTAGTRQEEGRA
jgi:hypothetical protein